MILEIQKLGLLTPNDTYVSFNNVVCVKDHGSYRIDGDLHTILNCAVCSGYLHYFALLKMYGIYVIAYEMPKQPRFVWLFADATSPSADLVVSVDFVHDQPAAKFTCAEVAYEFLVNLRKDAHQDGIDPDTWSVDQALMWQIEQLMAQMSFSISASNPQAQPSYFGSDGQFHPPQITSYRVVFTDFTELVVKANGPVRSEAGPTSVRNSPSHCAPQVEPSDPFRVVWVCGEVGHA